MEIIETRSIHLFITSLPERVPFMMNQYIGSKLIIVEGLTGSGKSTMAHFIARQLQYNDIAASWVHEGEVPHPFLRDLDTSIERYMAEILKNWVAYVNQIESTAEVRVVEACFFNNLLETLWTNQVEKSRIIRYADELLAISEPLNPTLIYLVQENVAQALERNINRRGPGFREFIIELSASTPLAHASGWEGFAGMLRFWQEFVALTDELFVLFPNWKLRVDNTTGDWDCCNQQVLDYLSLPLIREQGISTTEAKRLIGLYTDRQSSHEFTVRFAGGELTINLFSKVWTRLVRRGPNVFEAEGWPFTIIFEADDLSASRLMKICGREVDYLPLVGTVAEKTSA